MIEIMSKVDKNIFVPKTSSSQVGRSAALIMTIPWTMCDSKPLTSTELRSDHYVRARVIPSTTIFDSMVR